MAFDINRGRDRGKKTPDPALVRHKKIEKLAGEARVDSVRNCPQNQCWACLVSDDMIATLIEPLDAMYHGKRP